MLTYVPSDVTLNILGLDVEGYSDGTFISIQPENPTYSFRRTFDGSTLAVRNKWQSYNFTVTLQQSSPSNNWLHLLYTLFKEYNIPFVMPILMRDKSGTSTFFASDCWFEKEPTMNFGKTLGDTVWEIRCNNGAMKIGGNGEVSAVVEVIGAIQTALSLAGNIGIDLGIFQSALEDTLGQFGGVLDGII